MSTADYGELGEPTAVRASSILQAGALESPSFDDPLKASSTVRTNTRSRPWRGDTAVAGSTSTQIAPAAASPEFPSGKVDVQPPDTIARNQLLRESVFPDWKDDSGRTGVDTPDEMQKKDPLATQIWKLYSRTKTRLPNQERMENLTWRMMAMSLRRREQMQSLFVIPACLRITRRHAMANTNTGIQVTTEYCDCPSRWQCSVSQSGRSHK